MKLDSAGLRGARERGDAKVSSLLRIRSIKESPVSPRKPQIAFAPVRLSDGHIAVECVRSQVRDVEDRGRVQWRGDVSKVVEFVPVPRKPKWLFTIGVYEEPDGTEVAVLEDMPVSGIREDLSPADRVRALAEQLHRAANTMSERAVLIEEIG